MAVTDAIIEQCGPLGKYHLLQSIVTGFALFSAGQLLLMSTFHNFEPKHRCALPGWNNDTYEIQSDSHNQTLIDHNITDSCHINGTECTQYVYSKERYQGETIVTKFNLVCSNTKLSTISTTVFTATLSLGVLIGGAISDRIGRKWSHLAMIGFSFVCNIGVIFSQNYIMYVVLRCGAGAGIIGAVLISNVAAFEIVGPTQRHKYAVLKSPIWPIGTCSLSLIAYLLPDWKYIQIVVTVFVAINGVIVFVFMKETPQYLLSQHRVDEAKETLKCIARWNNRSVKEHIYERLNEEAENVKKEKFRQISKSPTLIKRYIIFLYLWIIPGLGYYGMQFNVKNMSGNLFLNNLLLAGIDCFSIIPLWLMFKVGRKPVYITLLFVGSAALFVFAGLSTIKLNNVEQNVQLTISLIGKLSLITMFTLNFLWNVEIFPTSLRSVMMGSSCMFARFGMIASPLIVDLYKYVYTPLGTGLGPLIFAVVMLIGGIAAFFLPETNHMRIPETIHEANIFLTKGHIDEFRQTKLGSSSNQIDLKEDEEKTDTTM